jgi:hypothetical protein
MIRFKGPIEAFDRPYFLNDDKCKERAAWQDPTATSLLKI